MKPEYKASSAHSPLMQEHSVLEIPRIKPLRAKQESYVGQFRAMGSPCEVLMQGCTLTQARHCVDLLSREAWRIERKFSRYRDDNIVAKINHSKGCPVEIDSETARLIETANSLWNISGGLFDITSGCLRRAWVFDQSDHLPAAATIDVLLQYIGWEQVRLDACHVTLPEGFEIDFGGIGKEYATDRCLQRARKTGIDSILVNLGGDIAAFGSNSDNDPWRVGIESTDSPTAHDATITFSQGGIATSGDTNKYVLKDGIRYGHVLNPTNGWPIADAPQSITVAASTCSEAGMYSTLAMLHGADAEQFLVDNSIKHWVQRE